MKKTFTRVLAAVLGTIVCASSALLTSCSSGDAKTVSTDGSTSMEKVVGALGEAFEAENSGTTFTYNPTGSGSGITAVLEGRCDIGLSSRALKDDEKAQGLTETVLAYDGIAIIVNPENTVEVLTVDRIASIYKGEITNWSEVGGEDAEIAVFGRDSASGQKDAPLQTLEAALRLMQSYSPSMFVAMFQKATDPDAQQVIHDGLVLQTAQSPDIADVRALKDNLAQILFFVSSVGQYADGVAAAADGAHAAKDGGTQLVAGAQALLNGANRLVDGTHQLHSGLNQFNEEGVSQLTGALDPDQLHALKTVLDAMMGRMEEYTSFSGAPEGAVSSMKFLYKTAENVEPAALSLIHI